MVGSIPTLPPGWRLPMVKRFSPTNRQPLTPLSRTAVQAGPSRSRPPRCRYSLACPQHPKMLGRPPERRCLSPTSATEQLSRAPWGTHAPERRARTLPTAASGAAPFRRLLCRRGNDPFRTRRRRTTTRAIRPRVAPRLAPLAPAGDRHQPAAVRTVARDCFFLRGSPHTRLCRPCTRWLTNLLTLPVAPPSLPDLLWPSGFLTEPRAPSTDGTPMPPLSEPEASSTDESRIRAPLLARKGTVRAATSAPGFATRAPLPTRVHPLAAS